MSIQIGEAYITLGLENKAFKELEKSTKQALSSVKKGEKGKQTEINKTNAFFEKQSAIVGGLSNRFSKFATNLTGAFLSINAIAGVSAVALNSLITSTTNFAQAQLKAQDISGTSTESIQKLANAYSSLGNVDFMQATSELASFSQKIERAKIGLESPADLMVAGVRFNQSTTLNSAINDLRKNLGNRSSQEVSAYLERAGLSSDLLYIIKSSNAELEQFNKIPILSQQQLKSIQTAGRGFDRLKKLINSLVKVSQAKIAPYLRLELDRIFKTISLNQDKIVDFIGGTTKWIGKFIKATMEATGFVGGFISSLMSSKVGFLAVAGGVSFLIARTKPLWALLGGVIILLEDIKKWRQTGESPFAKFYEGLAKIYTTLNSIVPLSKVLQGGLIALGGVAVVNGVMSLAGALGGVATSMLAISNTPLFKALLVGGAVFKALQGVYDIVTGSDTTGIRQYTQDKIAPYLQNQAQNGGLLQDVGKIFFKETTSELNPQIVKDYQSRMQSVPSSQSNAINNNQQFTINIDGAGKQADTIAKEVTNEIGKNYNIDMQRLNALFPNI